MTKAYSHREYLLAWIAEGNVVNQDKIFLDRLFYAEDNDFEYIYALQESIDDILNMQLFGIITAQFDRGDDRVVGIIKRIR